MKIIKKEVIQIMIQNNKNRMTIKDLTLSKLIGIKTKKPIT